MGRARRVVLAIASTAIVWVAGGAAGATKVKTKPTQAAPKPAAVSQKTARPVLPEWAPKNPSPEFLRAAQVLKLLPLDIAKSPARTDAENAIRIRGTTIKWTAAYELFGTLSDEQVERFLQSKPKHLVIPIKQLTQRQRSCAGRVLRGLSPGPQRGAEHPRASRDR